MKINSAVYALRFELGPYKYTLSVSIEVSIDLCGIYTDKYKLYTNSLRNYFSSQKTGVRIRCLASSFAQSFVLVSSYGNTELISLTDNKKKKLF
jgi:hypothetical protein